MTDQETNESTRALPEASFTMHGDLGQLFAAKAAARAGFKPIVRDKSVDVQKDGKFLYSFVYAPLETVIACTEEALSKNGLDLMWFLFDAPGGKSLRCILAHKSGAYISSTITIPPGERPQELGSALTYARRYQAQCVLGVAPEDDDDGAQAGGMVATPRAPKAPRGPVPPAAPQPVPQAAPARAPSSPPPPVTVSRTRTIADAGTGEAVQDETVGEIKAALRSLGYGKGPQVPALVMQVTGKTSEKMDQADAVKFLAFLRVEAAEKGVSL